jgi:hypothetical protein
MYKLTNSKSKLIENNRKKQEILRKILEHNKKILSIPSRKDGKSYNFQHNNKIKITPYLYKYVCEYKKQLLYNITLLFNDLNIKFVISHGNLIEYERKKPIYHDDDLDIRYDINDIYKWELFCSKNQPKLDKYNLIFDSRFYNLEKQKYNGIQCKLINIPFNLNSNNITNIMDIHMDVVPNKVISDFWLFYDIDYNNLRNINYLGINTYAPNIKDTKKVLETQYGKNYLIPNIHI